MDWYPIPVKEQELLFNGTEEDCIKYLLHEWYVDFYTMDKETLNKALHDIKCIQFLDIEVKYDDKYIPVHELMDFDDYDRLMGEDWQNIDPTQFIFNKEIISIT